MIRKAIARFINAAADRLERSRTEPVKALEMLLEMRKQDREVMETLLSDLQEFRGRRIALEERAMSVEEAKTRIHEKQVDLHVAQSTADHARREKIRAEQEARAQRNDHPAATLLGLNSASKRTLVSPAALER